MIHELHELLTDRNRLVIMTVIAAAKAPVSFSDLLGQVAVTKGNLSSHLKRLEEASLVEVTKEFVERKPRTSYRCTDAGRDKLRAHLKGIEALIKGALF